MEVKMEKKITTEKLQRSVLLERSSVNVDERTVELAFASENPVERWFGLEILDCSPKSVRLERLRSGGPVLVGHDSNDQVGVVERVSVDADKVCRATVRFSRSARGQEILQDIADGIRRNVSVGYMIEDAKMESKKGDVETYRATRWSPHEISIVSMPADIRVGIGRELETISQKETQKMEETKVQPDALAAEAQRQSVKDAEVNRIQSIIKRGNEFADKGGPAIAQRFILDPNATVETFEREMLRHITEQSKIIAPVAIQSAPSHASMVPPTVSLRYNRESLKSFERFGNKAEEMAFRAGMWSRAVLFNDREAQRWCHDQGIQQRVMTEMGGSSGGFTVPDEMEAAITDLRVIYGAARRLCRIIPMGSAVTSIPVRTGGVTAYFVNEAGAPTNSDMTWGQAQLVAKNLAAETRITTQLAEDAVIDIAATVADEHAQSFAAKEDACMLLGDGTSAYGGIVGINTRFEALPTTMKGAFVCASATADTFGEVAAGDLTSVMAKLPSYARPGAVWLGSPASDDSIFGRLLAAGGGNTIQSLQGGTGGAYLGKRREVNEYMPSDASADLSNKVIVLYGDFKKACLLGDRRGITIQVLRELYAVNGQIAILGTERFDFNCQYAVGDTSAAGSVTALIGGAS
jgi:HK97 family phage major capsid protein